MECLKCKKEMGVVKEIKNDYFKYRLFQCSDCKSFGHIYYHPNTENIRKAEWDEAE